MTRSPITDPQLIREALEAGQIRRVLAVRASRLGDLLMATPGLHAFHERYPEAEITFLTNEYSRAFLENDPDIHELITFKGRERDLLTSKAAQIRKEIQDKGIDLLLALRPRKEISALAEKLQIPYLFPLGQRGTDSDEIHVVQQTFDRIAPIGLTGDPGPMRLFLAKEDLETARALIPACDGPIILLHPGGDDTKRLWLWRGVRKRIWPKNHWAELIQRLESGLGARVLVSSGNAIEARWVEDILGRFDNQATHLSRLPLRQFCALFELSDLVITGDTGPLHIASALGRPQLCLFGPTAVTYTGPWNDKARVLRKEIPCSPCQGKKTRCLQNVCMEELLPSQVHGEARRYLEELAPPAAKSSAQ